MSVVSDTQACAGASLRAKAPRKIASASPRLSGGGALSQNLSESPANRGGGCTNVPGEHKPASAPNPRIHTKPARGASAVSQPDDADVPDISPYSRDAPTVECAGAEKTPPLSYEGPANGHGDSLEILDKKVAKKRGRKPKGGKLVLAKTVDVEEVVVMSNIILHLKCFLEDLVRYDKENGVIDVDGTVYTPSISPELKAFETINACSLSLYAFNPPPRGRPVRRHKCVPRVEFELFFYKRMQYRVCAVRRKFVSEPYPGSAVRFQIIQDKNAALSRHAPQQKIRVFLVYV